MSVNTHILLVDDDASLRATLRTCLEMADYHCMEAKDGYDARDWLEKGHPIDLIVIEHQMLRVSGLDLINGLKSQVNTKTIPSIFYAGQLTGDLKSQAIQPGLSAVLEKPFPINEFLDLVAEICEKTVK